MCAGQPDTRAFVKVAVLDQRLRGSITLVFVFFSRTIGCPSYGWWTAEESHLMGIHSDLYRAIPSGPVDSRPDWGADGERLSDAVDLLLVCRRSDDPGLCRASATWIHWRGPSAPGRRSGEEVEGSRSA